MQIIVDKQKKEAKVQLIGRLDTPASVDITPKFNDLKSSAGGTITIDCTGLEYISSSGLRLFINLRKAASEKGGRIILEGMNDDVRDVFEMVGFLRFFEVR